MQDLLLQLGDSKHLTREKALENFKTALDAGIDVQGALEVLGAMLQESGWERQYGALKGYAELADRDLADLKAVALDNSDQFLSHSEFRVRVAYGELLGALAKRHGLDIYLPIKPKLFEKIWASFQSGVLAQDSELTAELAKVGGAGWQSLETCMKTLQALMKGLKDKFEAHADEEFLRCMEQATSHSNRFVREIGHFTIGECYAALSQDFLSTIAPTTIKFTAKGLGDNWSQVRLAASTAARYFIEKMGARTEEYDSLLVPRICLNRYYVAEGVKLYNQATWKEYVGDQGKQKVALHAGETVKYYVSQCLSDNHSVREAACMCIAEMATKVGLVAAAQIQPFVPELISALLDCFKDASWTVRDASCLACAEFVTIFSNEAIQTLPELKNLWIAHLSDNITSVREHSAYAVCKAIKVYQSGPDDFLSEVKAYLEANLYRAREQAVYDVAHAHEDKKENEIMYSCGSLAPKLRRGGGCMDHGFNRPSHPWEFSDGCVYLIKEMVEQGLPEADSYVPRLADLLRLDEFKSANHLKETVWRQLASIAKAQGKLRFKRNLEIFFDPLFRDLKSYNNNVSVIAEEFLKTAAGVVGSTIFKARVEQHNPAYIELLP
mmetsp:Transcript_21132/g.39038  ORF Transcript_21132/g.39038 Transcript_21132/m.39038 type:complete len:610 (+) Transcript_21132:94-1923(+)